MKLILTYLSIFILSLIGFAQFTIGAPTIIRGEYFFDADPGVGNGTAIPITNPADSVELNFSISVSSLSLGLHNLYVRVYNDSGMWSMAENRLLNVYKTTVNTSIVASEYFFDTDNGVGTGTAVSVGTSADSVEFNSLISVSSLSSGLHNLYFRTKNADGIWSLAENRLVNIYKASVNSQIVSAEYFFDSDPGVGLGIALTLGVAADSVDFTSAISAGTISLGLHNLYIRTKNSDGIWSISENRLVNVFKNVNSQIVWSEYFFTNDPGVGNGTGAPIAVPGDSVEFTTSASTAGLGFGVGTHSIYMRTKNADGVWSLAEERTFSVCDTIGIVNTITGDTNIVACAHQNGITYSIDTVLNADFYVWNLPAGATIISGDSTTSITVNYSPYSTSGFVTVAGGFGQCVGTPTSMHVNFKPIPVTEICRITIDSSSQKSLLEWQKPSESYVSGYVIYREILGVYTAIDTVSNSLFSSYLDNGSTPNVQAEKYKIAVLDSCGNIGDTSATFQHETIYLYGFITTGSIAKLYWTDYIGITDSSRFYRVLYDPTGNGPFSILKDSIPFTIINWTDQLSGTCPACRYVVEMAYTSNCTPSLKTMTGLSTTRSNIKNKSALAPDGIFADSKNDIGFKIYPNPAKDLVNIVLKLADVKYEVSLIDILGKEILKSSSATFKNQSIVQLSLQGISKGLYFVKIKTDQREYCSKLNVE